MKRERHVFPPAEIPHLWAHKTQSEARSAGRGNIYFEGDTIYSYGSHFPIARHITSGKKAAVLFTTRSYSNTTAKHKHMVRGAIPYEVPVFEVPALSFLVDHAVNLKHYRNEIIENLEKSQRSRQYKQYPAERAAELRNELKAYAKFFKLKTGRLPKVPTETELENIRVADRNYKAQMEARNSDPAVLAERQRKAAKRLQSEFDKYSQAVLGWQQGILRRLPYLGYKDERKFENAGFPVRATLLRVSGEDVETSRGARVPVSHARRALELVRRVKESGQEWVANGHTFHIGVYRVDRISADGTLYAGCHVIQWAEIERIAPQILLDTPAGV